MSGQSTANEVGEMGYTQLTRNRIKINIFTKGGLGSNLCNKNKNEKESEACTNRPSLPSKDGISRNKVDVMEIASNSRYSIY